jgi:hypothetical protein
MLSQVYSTADGTKFVKEAVRKSEYRLLTDAKTFELAQALVDKASETDNLHDWNHVKNDITHIRYG